MNEQTSRNLGSSRLAARLPSRRGISKRKKLIEILGGIEGIFVLGFVIYIACFLGFSPQPEPELAGLGRFILILLSPFLVIMAIGGIAELKGVSRVMTNHFSKAIFWFRLATVLIIFPILVFLAFLISARGDFYFFLGIVLGICPPLITLYLIEKENEKISKSYRAKRRLSASFIFLLVILVILILFYWFFPSLLYNNKIN